MFVSERGVSMLDTTQLCTQNNTSKCAHQIRERCGLSLCTIWIQAGFCVSSSRYHEGSTQLPCGLYELHLGTLWVQSVPHMGTHYLPIWDPCGAHLHRLYGAKLGKLNRAHMEDHMGPIWVCWLG